MRTDQGTVIKADRPAAGKVHAHQHHGLRDRIGGQGLRLQPVRTDPRRGERDQRRNGDRHAEVHDAQRAQQGC
jgi:hypothetical protein